MRLSRRFKLGVHNWESYIPLVPTLRNYQREDFSHDLVAGLVVGVITIPQAVAYAFLAGVPPEAGLYACLVPMLLYSVFGSSRQLVVGPVAIAALMVAATVSEYAPTYSGAYLGITTIICLQVGLLLWGLRLSRMGGLVNLLSHPVITGFINAAAILIIISQLPAFTGADIDNNQQPWLVLADFLHKLNTVDPLVLVFGLVSFSTLLTFPYIIRLAARLISVKLPLRHPSTRLGPVVVAVIAISVVTGLQLQEVTDVVGLVPSGLPAITLPPFDADLWLELAPASLMIALVAYIESYSIGTTLAARQQTRVNAHQELIAIGAANIGAAFTGAYPVAGSFSRSSVNYYSGGRTPMSSVICAVVIVFTLLYLTPFFQALPKAVLAAIVMVSVVGLMDLKNGPRYWRLHKEDTITEYATLALVLFMGVEVGLIAGVALSIVFFIRTSSRPNITQVGRLADTEHFRSIKRYDVETLPHVLALRVDENIYFANATQIEDKFLKRVQRRRGTENLLIVCSSVNLIDVTGIQMLHRLNVNLNRAGIAMHLCDLKGTILPGLQKAGLIEAMTGQHFISADRAMRHFEKTPTPAET